MAEELIIDANLDRAAAYDLLIPQIAFPGHIACSSESRSELVVPISVDGQVIAVLDIDSHRLSDFSRINEQALVRISALLSDRYTFDASNES